MALSAISQFVLNGAKELFRPQISSNLTPYQLAQINRPWGELALRVSQGVGSLRFRETAEHICHATLVSIDCAIIPFHGLENKCVDTLEISFEGSDETCCFFASYKIVRVFALPALDFAILQLARGDDGYFPGCRFPILNCVGDPRGELLLVHRNENEEQVVTVRDFFPCTDRSGKLCTLSQTFFGSSGAPYFTICGKLVGIHLARATGFCSSSDQERAFLLLKNIWKNTFLSQRPYNCPLPTPQALPGCIPQIRGVDRCYKDEAKKPCDGRLGLLNGTYVELRLGSIEGIGRDSRGIQFDFEGKTLTYIFDKDPHEFGAYRRDNGPPPFYYNAAEIFEQLYMSHKAARQKPIPFEFGFNGCGHRFTAKLFNFDTEGRRYYVTPVRSQRLYF